MCNLLTILLSVIVSAQIDSATLVIGDQAGLHLQATANGGENVLLPLFDDEVVDGIDIVERSKIDTITNKDGQKVYSQDLVITSFKDTLFFIQSLPFVVNGDTVYSNSMSLNVIQPFEMDSTEAITDIKPVMRPKIWWWGIFRWILIALGIIAPTVGLYYLITKLGDKYNDDDKPVDPELLRPCDEVALEKLDSIKEAKIWQNGLHKQYFTDLTDVVREYIGRRFEVSSSEKTSNEILSEMKPILTAAEQKELYTRLEKMLHLADLVKFAKWTPAPDENEAALLSAYTLVKECGDIPQKTENNETDGDSIL